MGEAKETCGREWTTCEGWWNLSVLNTSCQHAPAANASPMQILPCADKQAKKSVNLLLKQTSSSLGVNSFPSICWGNSDIFSIDGWTNESYSYLLPPSPIFILPCTWKITFRITHNIVLKIQCCLKCFPKFIWKECWDRELQNPQTENLCCQALTTKPAVQILTSE